MPAELKKCCDIEIAEYEEGDGGEEIAEIGEGSKIIKDTATYAIIENPAHKCQIILYKKQL